MAEHKHGEMYITVQEKTFATFMKMVSWGAAIAVFLLIFIYIVNG